MEYSKFFESEIFEHEEPTEFNFRMFMRRNISAYMTDCKKDFRSVYDSEGIIQPGVNKRLTTAIIVWLLPDSVVLTVPMREFLESVGEVLSNIGEDLNASKKRLKEEHQRTIDLFNATSQECLAKNARRVEEENYKQKKNEEVERHYNTIRQKFTEVMERYVKRMENCVEFLKTELRVKSEILASISAMIAAGYCELEKKPVTPDSFDSIPNMLRHLIETASQKTELSIRLQKQLMERPEVADPLDAPPTAPECPICLGKYSDQRKMMFLTPCQHTVCVDCLANTVEKKECVICRSKIEKTSIVFY